MNLDATILKKRSSLSSFSQSEKRKLIFAEWLIAGTEIALILIGVYLHNLIAVIVDLLLLSPLKIGRALLYDTAVCDADAISLRLLFRCFRFGYKRSLFWRIGIWYRTFLTALWISLPTALVRFCREYVTNSHMEAIITWVYVSLLFLSPLLLICAIMPYLFSPFLCLYFPKTKDLFRTYKSLFDDCFTIASPICGYPFAQFLLFHVHPLTSLVEYNLRRAAIARERIELFLQKEMSANLERFRNM